MVQWDTNKKISSKGFSLNGDPFENRNIIGRVETESMNMGLARI
jgi:hypothetical protein